MKFKLLVLPLLVFTSLVINTSLAQDSVESSSSPWLLDSTDVQNESSVGYPLDIESFNEQKATSISVSPAIMEVVLDPGVGIEKVLILTNTARFPMPIKATVQGLTVNEDLVDDSYLVDLSVFDSKHWFEIEPADFILQPKEERVIKVKVFPPENASPGGHYATIFFEPLIPQQFLSASSAQVGTKVGVLVLSIVSGELVEVATVDSISAPSFKRSPPVQLSVNVKNEGNVHLLPYSEIHIVNMFGKKVEILKPSPKTILPRTVRSLTAEFDRKFTFGKFRAFALIRYGSEGVESISEDVTFWVVPWISLTIGSFLLTFIILFFTIFNRNLKSAFYVLIGRKNIDEESNNIPKDIDT